MSNLDWLERLEMLSARFSHLGIGPDLAAMTKSDLWGLYRFLSRLADLSTRAEMRDDVKNENQRAPEYRKGRTHVEPDRRVT